MLFANNDWVEKHDGVIRCCSCFERVGNHNSGIGAAAGSGNRAMSVAIESALAKQQRAAHAAASAATSAAASVAASLAGSATASVAGDTTMPSSPASSKAPTMSRQGLASFGSDE